MHLTDEQLNEYLDEAIPNRARVEAHLEACADCAARLAALKTLFAEIESIPPTALTHDLAPAVMRRLNGPRSAAHPVPRWLSLTAGLQAAAALIFAFIAGPFVIEAAAPILPLLPAASLNGVLLEAQAAWTAGLDLLSQLEMPAMPQLPASMDISGFYVMLTLAGAAMFWLVGNGLLLRNQIK